jgi:hypothetical protein
LTVFDAREKVPPLTRSKGGEDVRNKGLQSATRPGLNAVSTRRTFVRGSVVAATAVTAAAVIRPDVAEAHARPENTFVVANTPANLANATTPINAAITNANAAGGGVVYLPEGVWLLTGGSVVMKSNVWLRGVSMLDTVLQMPATLNQVVIDSPGLTGAVIENLTLNGLFASAGAVAALRYAGAKHCVARAVRIMSAGGSGISVGPVSAPTVYQNLLLHDTFIETAGIHGINVQPGNALTSIMIKGLSVKTIGTQLGTTAYGVRIAGRTALAQVQIDPVGSGDVGVGFVTGGGEYSTLTNYFIHTTGGTAYTGQAITGVALGIGVVQAS